MLEGHDAVAYFTRNDAVRGDPALQIEHAGVSWRFSSEENKAAFLRDHRPTSLIRRFTSADEVAALGVYLCSEAASGTSGAAMRVDGGVVNQIM